LFIGNLRHAALPPIPSLQETVRPACPGAVPGLDAQAPGNM
jgi:hypothetical protein